MQYFTAVRLRLLAIIFVLPVIGFGCDGLDAFSQGETSFELEFQDVGYSYDSDFVGTEGTIQTLGGETALGETTSGTIRSPQVKDGMVLGLVTDPDTDRVLAMDMLLPATKPTFEFTADRAAASFVLMNPIFWGWDQQILTELYDDIQNDFAFDNLANRMASSNATGAAFYEDPDAVAVAYEIAARVAQTYSEEFTLEASGGMAPQAILQPVQPLPRFVTVAHPDASDERVIRARNRGLLAERIACFERGKFDNTMSYLKSNAENTECSGEPYLGGPKTLFGFIPVSSIPVIDYFAGGPIETTLTLDAAEGEYKVFEVIPCATCNLGTPWVDHPGAENTLGVLSDIFGFVLGSKLTADKLSSTQKAAVMGLYTNLWAATSGTGPWISAARNAADGQWKAAMTDILYGIKDNANAMMTLLGVDGDLETRLAEAMLRKLAPLMAPSIVAPAKAVVEGGTGVYVAARTISLFWVAGQERITGDWDRALVATDTPRMEIAFLIDSTGSMGGIIDEAKAAVQDIANSISAEFPDTRFAVADFKDFPEGSYGTSSDYPYELRSNLSSSVSDLSDGLALISASGGNDSPEAHLYALEQSNQDLDWSSDAFPVVVLVSDVDGHDSAVDPSYPGPTFDSVAADLKAGSVKVIGLSAGYSATTFMERLAKATNTYTPSGGPAVFSVDIGGSDLADSIVSSVVGLVDSGGTAPAYQSADREAALKLLPKGGQN